MQLLAAYKKHRNIATSSNSTDSINPIPQPASSSSTRRPSVSLPKLQIEGHLQIKDDQILLYRRGDQLLVCAHDFFPLIDKKAFNSLDPSKREAWIANKINLVKYGKLKRPENTCQAIKQPQSLKENIKKEGGYVPESNRAAPYFLVLNTIEENIKTNAQGKYAELLGKLVTAYKEHLIAPETSLSSLSSKRTGSAIPRPKAALAFIPDALSASVSLTALDGSQPLLENPYTLFSHKTYFEAQQPPPLPACVPSDALASNSRSNRPGADGHIMDLPDAQPLLPEALSLGLGTRHEPEIPMLSKDNTALIRNNPYTWFTQDSLDNRLSLDELFPLQAAK